MALNTLRFSSIILTAVSMGAELAHLFALPHKLTLSATDYFAVQQIYAGWALLGIVIVLALLSSAILAWLLRHQRGFGLALAASGLIIAALALFFIFIYPANQATINWTVQPANWSALRQQWEYAHALSALLYLLALGCLTGSVLRVAGRAGYHRTIQILS